MLIFFQILFILFAGFTIINIFKMKMAGSLGAKGAAFWILFWLSAIVAVMWPDSTTILANRFGIGRGTDFVLYISIAIIFYLIFKLHIKIESIGRDITKIVRKESLEKNKNVE